MLLLAACPAQANNPWQIAKDHWSEADERGFSKFVQAIGETNCASAESCLNSAANPYRAKAQLPGVKVDCAKWPYLLRAYYGWNNGLPFSYVSAVNGEDDDLRYTKTADYAVSWLDLVDQGHGIDADTAIRGILASVFTGMYRINPNENVGLTSDLYSPMVRPGSIHVGTMLYDTQGHVGIVYKVGTDGRVYYMDAHPDFTITRGVYGPQFPYTAMQLGGGFKNWRPFQLAGATRDAEGHLIGGRMAFAANAQIADFSLQQYTGNIRTADGKSGAFQYNGITLGPYEYVRVVLSGGTTKDAPLYTLKAEMRSLCGELHKAKSANAAARRAATQFYSDMADALRLWTNRDAGIVYDGEFLKRDLEQAYDRESRACLSANKRTAKSSATMTFLDLLRRNIGGSDASHDVKALIENIGEQIPLEAMKPVGR